MAASSASVSSSSQLIPPVSLVVSDIELPNDGSSVVSSCVLRQFFEFFEVSRVRRAVCDQYPVGRLLPVSAPTLHHIVENFPYMTRRNYATIAAAHFVNVQTSDRKDHICDMLRVHVCDARCVNCLTVFVLLKSPRRYYAHQMMSDPFSVTVQPMSRSQVTKPSYCHSDNHTENLLTNDFLVLLSFEEKRPSLPHGRVT